MRVRDPWVAGGVEEPSATVLGVGAARRSERKRWKIRRPSSKARYRGEVVVFGAGNPEEVGAEVEGGDGDGDGDAAVAAVMMREVTVRGRERRDGTGKREVEGVAKGRICMARSRTTVMKN